MRVRHGVHMGEWWLPENYLRLQESQDIHWKNARRRKRNRPVCGAKCRDGHACNAKVVVDSKTDKPINGRCRMHGGLSSGAKTEEGKERCRQAARKGMLEYWKKKKSEKS